MGDHLLQAHLLSIGLNRDVSGSYFTAFDNEHCFVVDQVLFAGVAQAIIHSYGMLQHGVANSAALCLTCFNVVIAIAPRVK
jgi:hypothetical protein